MAEPWCAEIATVPEAAATTVSPRSASAVLPRLKSISYDRCALLALELPVHDWPQGKGSWKFVASIWASADSGAGSAAAGLAVPRPASSTRLATIAP
ncbi:hypothetical protein GCM10020001_041960 [Nonomuraea salmonea]